MQVTTFDDGFRHELANRDFARIAMTRLRSRTRGRPEAEFWGSYARLEEFNAPIYRTAAQRMGVTYTTSLATRLRGELVGATPRPLLTEILRLARLLSGRVGVIGVQVVALPGPGNGASPRLRSGACGCGGRYWD